LIDKTALENTQDPKLSVQQVHHNIYNKNQ
jgi:hypothetical protein